MNEKERREQREEKKTVNEITNGRNSEKKGRE